MKKQKLDIDSIMKLAPLEERIYRHRCVEGWSMVIPWVGIPLSALIKQADPLPSAKFVAFQTVSAPDQMPNQKTRRAGLALRRRLAHGRSHASADHPRRRSL